MQVPLIRLQCGVNNYVWGKSGKESAAARFAAATPSDGFSIEEDKPYSEIWMGTHPKTPSKDLETQRPLLDLLKDNQALMSKEVWEKYGGSLPFLFKVLSIDKPLSVQAHPNKKLAEKLHKKDPENYPGKTNMYLIQSNHAFMLKIWKDDNHKPEMALALTPFEGMCGFRPLAEIEHFFSTVPAFRKLVGEDAVKEFESTVKGQETSESNDAKAKNKKALQTVFSGLMTSEKSAVQAAVKELVKQAKEEGEKFAGGGGPSNNGKELADLVIRLNSQFEGDIGIMALFFLNYVKLAPGEAMFLKADDIHAYISGDIIECMANSDNVVRAGFSPKFQDISTLTSMLTYTYAPISEQKMKPVDYPYAKLNSTAYSSGSSVILYDPPIEEFSIVKTELRKPGSKATFEPIQGPSIVICTSGKGKISVGPKSEVFNEGYIYFVGATAELVLESTGEECTSYRAFCELSHKGTNGTQ